MLCSLTAVRSEKQESITGGFRNGDTVLVRVSRTREKTEKQEDVCAPERSDGSISYTDQLNVRSVSCQLTPVSGLTTPAQHI